MFFENVDQKAEQNEKKIALMEMRLQRFEKAFQEIYDNINLLPEELAEFLNNAANFPPEVWMYLQGFKDELDDKLQKELDNIRNPSKTAQTYAERKGVQQHWLFVR
jgi:hypothetical protein